MKLEQSFEVQAPLQRVWEALIDVERVAPCLPGASVTGKNPDGTYNGEFKVKIGPTSAAYTGKLQMENVDESSHSATMLANGTDRRGQGGAKATIVSSVAEAANGATTVHVDTDYHITGRLARFGRGGMIEEISNRLLGEFASSLQQMLAGSGDDVPAAAAASSEAAASATTDAVGDEQATTEVAAVPEPADTPAPADGPAPADVPAPVDEPAPLEPPPAVQEPPAAPQEPPAAVEPPPAVEPAAADEAAPAVEPPPTPAPAPAPPVPPPTPPTAAPTPGPTVESEPLDALSLVRVVVLNQIKENPVPVLGAIIGFLLALRLLRRRR